MFSFKNIFACLVHEKPECVIDLVRNLKYLDPASDIILYNGSNDPDLLSRFPFEWYGAKIHPAPKPMKWGWLHGFALDCMRFAIEKGKFDSFTIVDSDQLCLKKGYSDFISQTFNAQPEVGLFGNNPYKQTSPSMQDVAVHANKEKELWLPLLETMPGGKDAFLYWSFWPSTIFSYDACKDLTALFDKNEVLKDILTKTTIWASEEVILPTLVKALGYEIGKNPCTYDYVQYKKNFSVLDLQRSSNHQDAYWMHPVPRSIQHELRKSIAKRCNHYSSETGTGKKTWVNEILEQTKFINGWLSAEEAEMLIDITDRTLQKKASPVIVEVGSYCGKSTCTIALTSLKTNRPLKLFAVDPFEGLIGAEDERVQISAPTFVQFKKNIELLGLDHCVFPIQAKSEDVNWDTPIDFLFIDGLHDYFNVARDFFQFEHWVNIGGYIAFHDYADYYPGVKSFVSEIISTGDYKKVATAGTILVVEKINNMPVKLLEKPVGLISKSGTAVKVMAEYPMISCITPTFNRHEFLLQSIEQFLKQDYDKKELVIIDDSDQFQLYGDISMHPAIRYVKLDTRQFIGTKRNIACNDAKGEIIVHWDDDDWYAQNWLTIQAKSLISSGIDVTGLDKPFFYSKQLEEAWQYLYPENEKKWVYGATLAYWKKVWQHNHFSEINIGEDNNFVWKGTGKVLAHQYTQGYLGCIHSGNTSPKYTAGNRWKKVDPQTAKSQFPIK